MPPSDTRAQRPTAVHAAPASSPSCWCMRSNRRRSGQRTGAGPARSRRPAARQSPRTRPRGQRTTPGTTPHMTRYYAPVNRQPQRRRLQRGEDRGEVPPRTPRAPLPRQSPSTRFGPRLSVSRACGHFRRQSSNARKGRGTGAWRPSIGRRAAPAFVKSSGDGRTAPIHVLVAQPGCDERLRQAIGGSSPAADGVARVGIGPLTGTLRFGRAQRPIRTPAVIRRNESTQAFTSWSVAAIKAA